MNPSQRYAGSAIEKLLDSKGKLSVKISLGIDLSKTGYFKLPEGERGEIVEGVSYNNSFRHDGAVDFFLAFVIEHDESEDIRRLAGKKLTDYGETESPVQMADND